MKQFHEDEIGDVAGPFKRFSTRVWRNARANTVRCAMLRDVYFSFSETLLKGLCAYT